MKNKLSILFLILIPCLNIGQGFIEMDTISTPKELETLISGNIKITYGVDFDGNGSKDYICQLHFQDGKTPTYKEIWITSDYKIYKTIVKYNEDYDFFWFINLDFDPEPELFSASGYSDGIDYCIIDQNLETGKDSILFYLNPIIIENNKYYWGYPWDLTDLIIREENDGIKIRCSLEHEINRDGEITHPIWQRIFPVIFFTGSSTQPNVEIGQIHNLKWKDVKEIQKEIVIDGD